MLNNNIDKLLEDVPGDNVEQKIQRMFHEMDVAQKSIYDDIDTLRIIKWIVLEAGRRFSTDGCEDLPEEIQKIVNRHPEWIVEYHNWNGDPEVLEYGDTYMQTSTLASWAILQIKRMLEDV